MQMRKDKGQLDTDEGEYSNCDHGAPVQDRLSNIETPKKDSGVEPE